MVVFARAFVVLAIAFLIGRGGIQAMRQPRMTKFIVAPHLFAGNVASSLPAGTSQIVVAVLIGVIFLLAAFGWLCLLVRRGMQSRNAVAASEARFRAMVETATDWLWEADAELRFTYCSPGMVRDLGYESEELLGEHPARFIALEDAEALQKAISSLLNSRQPGV